MIYSQYRFFFFSAHILSFFNCFFFAFVYYHALKLLNYFSLLSVISPTVLINQMHGQSHGKCSATMVSYSLNIAVNKKLCAPLSQAQVNFSNSCCCCFCLVGFRQWTLTIMSEIRSTVFKDCCMKTPHPRKLNWFNTPVTCEIFGECYKRSWTCNVCYSAWLISKVNRVHVD